MSEARDSRREARGTRRGLGWAATIALGLLALTGATHAADVPKQVEILYRVSVGPFTIGEGRDVFQHDGKTYRVVSEAKTVGVASIYRLNVVRESIGRVTPNGLLPQAFSEMRNGKPKRSVRFDWGKQQATLTDGDNQQVVPLPENTWDQTSFGYSFAFAGLKSDALSANLTDGRRIKEYNFAVVGSQPLETELGTLDTIHVKKVLKQGDKRSFEVWIAPSYNNMPVRMRLTEKDGTTFDSVVAKVTVPGR
jgi:hypothetical protein